MVHLMHFCTLCALAATELTMLFAKFKGVRHLFSRHLLAVLPMPWPRRAGSCTTARQTASMDPSGSTALSMRTVRDGASNPDPDRLCLCCWFSSFLSREPAVGQHQKSQRRSRPMVAGNIDNPNLQPCRSQVHVH
jgi:hypothetical protein